MGNSDRRPSPRAPSLSQPAGHADERVGMRGQNLRRNKKRVSKKVNKSIELSRSSFHLKGISTNTKIPTSFDKSS